MTTTKLTLNDMILAGKYDRVNRYISERRFPTPESFVPGAEPKVYLFDEMTPREKVISLMDADGYRPATIFDLLDYGAKNPEEQRRHPIVALGSITEIGIDHVPCLRVDIGDDSLRVAVLEVVCVRWPEGSHFLAVRK